MRPHVVAGVLPLHLARLLSARGAGAVRAGVGGALAVLGRAGRARRLDQVETAARVPLFHGRDGVVVVRAGARGRRLGEDGGGGGLLLGGGGLAFG